MTSATRKISWIIVALASLTEIAFGSTLIVYFSTDALLFIIGIFLTAAGSVSQAAVYALPLDDDHEVYFPTDQTKHVCVDGRWYVKTDFLVHI